MEKSYNHIGKSFWWAGPDSDRRPSARQADVLTRLDDRPTFAVRYKLSAFGIFMGFAHAAREFCFTLWKYRKSGKQQATVQFQFESMYEGWGVPQKQQCLRRHIWMLLVIVCRKGGRGVGWEWRIFNPKNVENADSTNIFGC